MPNARRHFWARSRPMNPNPTMPSVFPWSWVGQPGHPSPVSSERAMNRRSACMTAVRVGDALREREHQADAVLRHRRVLRAGGVHHDDPGFGGGAHVDLVDARAVARDHLEARPCGDVGGRPARAEAVRAGQHLCACVRRQLPSGDDVDLRFEHRHADRVEHGHVEEDALADHAAGRSPGSTVRRNLRGPVKSATPRCCVTRSCQTATVPSCHRRRTWNSGVLT